MKTKFMLFIALVVTNLSAFATKAVDSTKVTPAKPFVIVLDAGHGGHDPGKRVGTTNEKDIALDIILQIGAKLEKTPGFNVLYTRKTDVFVKLGERAAIANRAKADFFVSVHCNAAASTSASGNETWILGTSKGTKENLDVVRAENSVILLEDDYKERYVGFDPNDPSSFADALLATEEYLEASIKLAANVQNNFQKDLARKNRGVKQANFAVLRLSYMPSVLIETGFVTNDEERAFLNSAVGKQKYANAIFNAIIQYHEDRDLNVFAIDDIEIEPVATPDVPKKFPAQVTSSTGAAGQVYKVQLAASSKKIEERSSNFKNLPHISRVKVGAVYKYYAGKVTSEAEARELLAAAKAKGYTGAFIVIEENGTIKNL